MNTYKRRQPAYTPPENVGVIVASAFGNKEKYGVMQLVDLESASRIDLGYWATHYKY